MAAAVLRPLRRQLIIILPSLPRSTSRFRRLLFTARFGCEAIITAGTADGAGIADFIAAIGKAPEGGIDDRRRGLFPLQAVPFSIVSGLSMKPGPRAIGPSSERLAGVDVMRGFGAFGVICVHAGLVVGNRISPAGAALQAWFDFVVPFFLVTAFYFALRGEKARAVPWRDWLRQRFARLLVPYFIWSVVYLALHVLKLCLDHQTGNIRSLFQDPVGLLLDGGTGLALYFLPLLFVGLVVAHAFRAFLATAPLWLLGIGLLGVALAAFFVTNTGNGYDLGSAKGFRHALPGLNGFPPARLLLALLADAVRCLPLIATAAILVRVLSPFKRPSSGWALLIGGVALALPLLASQLGASRYLPEFIAGSGAFLVGWGLPVPAGRITAMVGLFSFGVYLVHQVVLEAMQVAVQKAGIEHLSLSIFGVVAVSLLAYALSMLIVGMASRGGSLLRRIFALL
jgi:peptidoglycan/LPS O-acetylase OafA/YrhL